MQTETKYGKVLFHSILTPQGALKRRTIYLIIALCILGGWFFAFWATGHLDPNSDPVPLGMGWVILLLVLVPIFIRMMSGVFTIKASEAAVFEEGLMHSCKSKVTDLALDDIAGIRDLSEKTTWVVAIILPFLTMRSRGVTIFKKDGTTIEISKSQAYYFDEFADTFVSVFTGHLLNGITKETIGQANIPFGPKLALVSGQLEYSPGEDDSLQMRDGKLKFVKGEGGKRIIPFDDIAGLQPDEDGHYISLVGKESDNGKPVILASFKTDEAQNMMVLHELLDMMV